MDKQVRYDFEYEANGQRVELKNKTLDEINTFINQLKAEKESSMRLKRIKKIKEDEEEER